jgi:hypothetical protein
MIWDIEYTDEFGAWWDTLTEKEQDAVKYTVGLLEQEGTQLNFPHCSKINGSRHGNMRELRSTYAGHEYRTFYAFDPRRTAILLIGGDKTGDDRFYQEMISTADAIYDEYLKEIQEESK